MSEAVLPDAVRKQFHSFTHFALIDVRDALSHYVETRPEHQYGLCHWMRQFRGPLFGGENVVSAYRWATEGTCYPCYVTPRFGFNGPRLAFAIKLRDALTEYLRSEAG